MALTSSRFAGASSATSTRISNAAPSGASGAASGASAAGAGASNQNVEPRPGALSAPIWPPIISTSRRLIASPSPVPPYRRVVDASAWAKRWNSAAILASGMPMPVSLTSTLRRPSRQLAHSRISPSVVNFAALDRKFSVTCRNRPTSPINQVGASSANSSLSAVPRADADPSTIAAAASIMARRSKAIGSISTRPASSLE